ncbi:twin-arginine translocation signal domain-containing protein [Streptomyces sp. NPDC085866]|uniref:twin-arginine translocation signal domain-containing protein n=1 Tax=Streptomyces sp. NPDC085866 TaxID=3365736 RepID=UPI0037D1B575
MGFGFVSRRGFLGASAAGVAAAVSPATAPAAGRPAVDAGEQILTYLETTGGSVTACRDGSVGTWLEVARALRRDSCCHAGDGDTP